MQLWLWLRFTICDCYCNYDCYFDYEFYVCHCNCDYNHDSEWTLIAVVSCKSTLWLLLWLWMWLWRMATFTVVCLSIRTVEGAGYDSLCFADTIFFATSESSHGLTTYQDNHTKDNTVDTSKGSFFEPTYSLPWRQLPKNMHSLFYRLYENICYRRLHSQIIDIGLKPATTELVSEFPLSPSISLVPPTWSLPFLK